MKKHPQKNKGKMVLLLVLLAVVCIGGVELMFCRHFAPELYADITRPVSDAVASVAALYDQGKAYLAERFTPQPGPPEEAPLEEQLASEPMLAYLQGETDPAVTQLVERDGVQVLTGGNVEMVYYDQGAEQWAQQPYGTDQIGGYGCGPTAMAMVVSSMTQERMDPAQMAQWAVDNGYWARKQGSYRSIVQGTAEAFGLTAQPAQCDTVQALRLELAAGNIMVALMGPGHFTKRGHFIILRGVTLDGSILVADPNGEERSLLLWDAQLILDELSASRDSGAPLWTISLQQTK